MLKYFLRPLFKPRVGLLCARHLSSALPAEPSFVVQTKYTDEDVSKIMTTVNNKSLDELLNYDISKGRAQKIRTWINRNGAFTSVDQLLELDGFGITNLDKFCVSIVRGVRPGGCVRPVPRSQQFTTPAITKQMRAETKSFTSIHIGITSISWAQIEVQPGTPSHLSDWSFNMLPENKLHIAELVSAVLDIVKRIPDSDLYVFETPRVAHQGPQGTPATINISVQMSQIAAMAALAVASRKTPGTMSVEPSAIENESGRVFFLRQFLASRLFQTIVGMERTSTENVVSSMLAEADENAMYEKTDCRVEGEIIVSPELRNLYVAGQGHCKEYLGQSLLMGLSFLRLCLLECPHSMSVLKAKARNKKGES